MDKRVMNKRVIDVLIEHADCRYVSLTNVHLDDITLAGPVKPDPIRRWPGILAEAERSGNANSVVKNYTVNNGRVDIYYY